MADLTFSLLLAYFVTGVVFLLTAAYLYFTYVYKYFKRRGIPYEPSKFPFGILWPVLSLKIPYNFMLYEMYKKNKGNKFVGFFQFLKKSVLIVDRELIKNVMVKDFEYFDRKGVHYNKKLEPLTATLFALDGPEWRILRTKMTPAFTSGKLKNMFMTIGDIGNNLRDYVSKQTSENDVVECKDLFIRYGLAIIASTAFGLDSDVLSDKSSAFFKVAETLAPPTIGGLFRLSLMFYGAEIAKMFSIRIIPKQAHEFYMNLVRDTMQYRETQGKTRNDFIQLLLELKHGARIGDQEFNITLEEMAAQCFVFIIGGFETTSNTMSFFLYEMATNPEIQNKIHAEVDAAEEITYETLAAMEYLEMAVDETLRKHAPLGFLARVCSKDYQVPGTEQIIEKGTQVLISTHGLHHDPELFPEPERFIPERFSKENKNNIQPFSYMPFGDGPRVCIAMRFGKLFVKAGLATLLRQFEVRLAPETPDPLQYGLTMNTSPAGGMLLRFVKRDL